MSMTDNAVTFRSTNNNATVAVSVLVAVPNYSFHEFCSLCSSKAQRFLTLKSLFALTTERMYVFVTILK
jgi:hypothetical protein